MLFVCYNDRIHSSTLITLYSKNIMKLNRKEFLHTLGVSGVAFAAGGFGALDVFAQNDQEGSTPDIVAVMGGEPDVMFQKAIGELGGMERFVKKGNKVVIKPNIGWDKTPVMAANTNPILVGEMVKQALAAGASEVIVFDWTVNEMRRCYETSGIEAAAKAAGAKVLPADNERYFKEVELPEGKTLKKVKVHEAIVDCDVWFNVPILKVHGGSKMTIAMKNYMGIIWDRRIFHSTDLHQCVADVCTWSKKPVLNVVDAYRILKANGPGGRSEADAVLVKALLVSPNIVAVDAASTKLAQQFTNIGVDEVTHIAKGQELKLGTADVESLNIKRIRL